MPEGINLVIRQRKNAVKRIWDFLKAADSAIEVTQRFISRLMKLRRKVPTGADFIRIAEGVRNTLDALQQTDNAIADAVSIFRSEPSQALISPTGTDIGDPGASFRSGRRAAAMRGQPGGGFILYDDEGKVLHDTKKDGPLTARLRKRYGIQ